MRSRRDFTLRLEIATALAVFAMMIQVVLAPLLQQQHAYSFESDYGLSLICGHQQDGLADEPNAPPSNSHLHDCPCCFSVGGHVVLPEALVPAEPVLLPTYGGGADLTTAQVSSVATVSEAQLPRAPPTLS